MIHLVHKLLNKEILNIYVKFVFIFAIANVIANISHFLLFPGADIPLFWPISVFKPSLIWPLTLLGLPYFKTTSLLSFVVAGTLYSIVFTLVVKHIDNIKSVKLLYLVGILSIFLSNTIRGIHEGLFYPVAGETASGQAFQYYHDAVKILDPYVFLSTYNEIQPELLMHAATHPPGAVLIYYYLNKYLVYPELSSLFLMLVSVPIVYYVYKLVQMSFEDDLPAYMGLIFIFIPAVQIYFLSALDSLISLAFIGILYYYLQLKREKKLSHIVMLFLFLFITSFFTYLVVYPLLVIFIDMMYRRNYQVALLLPIMIFIILVIYHYFNYDYIAGFLMTSQLENPKGFRLLSAQRAVSYIFTRFENIAEIIFFLGPLLSIAAYKGIRNNLKEESIQFVLISIFSLLLFFLADGAKTGETARLCLFIYPLLMIPSAYYLREFDSESRKYKIKQILLTLWIQTIFMQTFGFYHW